MRCRNITTITKSDQWSPISTLPATSTCVVTIRNRCKTFCALRKWWTPRQSEVNVVVLMYGGQWLTMGAGWGGGESRVVRGSPGGQRRTSHARRRGSSPLRRAAPRRAAERQQKCDRSSRDVAARERNIWEIGAVGGLTTTTTVTLVWWNGAPGVASNGRIRHWLRSQRL